MRYLCLVYHETNGENSRIDDVEVASGMRDDLAELLQNGQVIAWFPLQPGHSTTIIRVRHGTVSMMDGSVAETGEQLGSFCLMEARDLNDAIRLAAKTSPGCVGRIEIRPLTEIPPR